MYLSPKEHVDLREASASQFDMAQVPDSGENYDHRQMPWVVRVGPAGVEAALAYTLWDSGVLVVGQLGTIEEKMVELLLEKATSFGSTYVDVFSPTEQVEHTITYLRFSFLMEERVGAFYRLRRAL